MADNKVQFGLKNAHYALWDTANGSYKTPVAIPGSVSLSLDAEGDTSNFYADDSIYFSTIKSNGYSGTYECAYLEQQARVDLLGDIQDTTTGLLVETTDAQPNEFALLFEIDGNVNKQAFVLHGCKLSRPSTEASTSEDTVEPNTLSLDFTCTGRDFTVLGSTKHVTKTTLENDTEHAAAFAKFYESVLLPSETATQSEGKSTKATA